MPLLAERLKELRGELSIYEVGKGTGINRGHIQRYESGELLPPIPKLKQIAEFYEVPYSELWFLYFEDLHNTPEEQTLILAWAKKKLQKP